MFTVYHLGREDELLQRMQVDGPGLLGLASCGQKRLARATGPPSQVWWL